MVYNTIANIRVALSMAASSPADATITYWQTLIDAMILSFKSDPDTNLAAIIELNRVGQIYNQTRKKSENNEWKVGGTEIIAPLSKEEKLMLNSDDSDVAVDSIPMNAKREWDLI